MKQLIQSYKTGELGLYEVPPPACLDHGVLVQNSCSLVSAGTEKMIIEVARKSLLGKAKSRPDLVRQIIDRMKREGILTTLQKVSGKLDTPIPLGYSCTGRVFEVGKAITGISVGDRVACGGAGYANHSEMNFIPKNLFVKVPDNVDDTSASFVTVGSIALQGVRQASPAIGEIIVVIGLGLIGQLTIQILKANGCKVIGADIDAVKLNIARESGADHVCLISDLREVTHDVSEGWGADGVIITASTSSNQPVQLAGDIIRLRGVVVVVGLVGMSIPREKYYKKELTLKLAMSYGPGRYDYNYEEKGIDYPYGYVRWTEQRNFSAFLDLIAGGRLFVDKLITHRFSFDEALKAYEMLTGKNQEKYVGIVLDYEKKGIETHPIYLRCDIFPADRLNLGVIGAGNFARSVLLPHISKLEGCNLIGLCTATGISSRVIGRRFGFQYITTEAEELYQDKQINCLIVATRHNDHAAHVLKALDNQKHIYVEKPLCINEDDLEEIKTRYEQAEKKIILQVGFNRRFSPLLQRVKEILNERPMSVLYRVNAGQIPIDTWVQDKEIGGGRIIGEVCHFIDTCSYLIGAAPVSVFANCLETRNESIPVEDNVNIVVNFSNGSSAVINYLAIGNRQVPKEFIEVFADDIVVQLNDFREINIYSSNRREKKRYMNQKKGFREELLMFREAVRTGKDAIPFDSIYLTSKTTFKILESIRKKKPIEIFR